MKFNSIKIILITLFFVSSIFAEFTFAGDDYTDNAGQRNSPSLFSDEWEFVVVPYIWFSGISGDISNDGQKVDIEAGFGDILDNLDIGLQIHAEAMKNRYFFFLDYTFLKLTIDEDLEPDTPLPVGGSLEVEVKEHLFDFAGGYRLAASEGSQVPVYLDLYGGGRLWSIDVDQEIEFENAPDISVDEGKTWVDPIIGTRIIALLTDNVIASVKTDIGGFGIGDASEFSWNFAANVGYDTGWHGLTPFLGWRTMYLDYDAGSVEYNIWMNGIQTGLGFRF